MPKFKTALFKGESQNSAGIVIPPGIMEALGPGKRPPVTVTINGYTYRSTIAVMGGQSLVGVAKEHRERANVQGGDTVEVTVERDDAPRTVDVPRDFAAALKKAGASQAFHALSYTHRKEHVRAIEEAKAPETRLRRIEKAVALVLAKKK